MPEIMPPRRVATVVGQVVGVVTAGALFATGCTQFGASPESDDSDGPAAGPAATVAVPPVRLTPFCQAMIDLADRLERDPPDDVQAAILDTYESITADVPDAIRRDFDAVLADLQGRPLPSDPASDVTTAPSIDPGPPATDETGEPVGDPFFDEGFAPEETPALRLNAYVDFECRDVANNPGPPPTQPLSDEPVDGNE